MSRVLKRVPIEFDHPTGTVWSGYLNPYQTQSCPYCQSGYSPQADDLHNQWYGTASFSPSETNSRPWQWDDSPVHELACRNTRENLFEPWEWNYDPSFQDIQIALQQSQFQLLARRSQREAERLANLFNKQWNHHLAPEDVQALIDADRLMITQSWSPEIGWHLVNSERPSAQEVNGCYLTGFGHDSINAGICIRAKCDRLGFPIECHHCNGEGILWESEEVKNLYESWEPVEPPIGLGFQLWETTSEGSPVSPVLHSLESLCEWCEENSTTFADNKVGKEKWMEMLSENRVYHQEGNAIFI